MEVADQSAQCLDSNVEEFAVINKQCVGVSKSHKHEAWGIHKGSNKFATSLETAYPMSLARIIAAQFVLALQRRGIPYAPRRTCRNQ